MKFLITGGCGFIGSHLVEHLLRKTNHDIVVIDKLTYASKGLDRLRDFGAVDNKRVKILTFDMSKQFSEGIIYELDNPDFIVHMAADTHVDNSIKDPVPFIENNVMSTVHLLEYARKLKNLKRFFYFSTDEVFGPAPEGIAFKEWDVHNPTNPYSASKSASENICLSYENTYKIPVMIVNVMNVFGERQHVEKFIPKVMSYLLHNKTIEIHSDPECKNPGTRFYIHARNVASAVLFLIENGKIGEKYNISGEREISNLEIVEIISNIMGIQATYKLVNFHSDRPGHDLRYCLDGSKLLDMGWSPPLSFDESIKKTVEWTLDNEKWLDWE